MAITRQLKVPLTLLPMVSVKVINNDFNETIKFTVTTILQQGWFCHKIRESKSTCTCTTHNGARTTDQWVDMTKH